LDNFPAAGIFRKSAAGFLKTLGIAGELSSFLEEKFQGH